MKRYAENVAILYYFLVSMSDIDIEGEMAAAIVTATTFNASIIVAATTPDRKIRKRA